MRTDVVRTSYETLIAVDEALTCAGQLVTKQDIDNEFEALAARIDVLRLQLYIVQDIVRSLIEGTPGRDTSTSSDL